MNTLKLMLMASFLALTIACDKDEDRTTDPFLGVWVITEATGTAASLNIGTQYDFQEDGIIVVGQGLLSSEGTYTKTESVITITLSGINLVFDYALSRDKLTLDNQTSDQVFLLERR